nr:MAG TPA: hypothetical protein [Caudoviricetes sp.]
MALQFCNRSTQSTSQCSSSVQLANQVLRLWELLSRSEENYSH